MFQTKVNPILVEESREEVPFSQKVIETCLVRAGIVRLVVFDNLIYHVVNENILRKDHVSQTNYQIILDQVLVNYMNRLHQTSPVLRVDDQGPTCYLKREPLIVHLKLREKEGRVVRVVVEGVF